MVFVVLISKKINKSSFLKFVFAMTCHSFYLLFYIALSPASVKSHRCLRVPSRLSQQSSHTTSQVTNPQLTCSIFSPQRCDAGPIHGRLENLKKLQFLCQVVHWDGMGVAVPQSLLTHLQSRTNLYQPEVEKPHSYPWQETQHGVRTPPLDLAPCQSKRQERQLDRHRKGKLTASQSSLGQAAENRSWGGGVSKMKNHLRVNAPGPLVPLIFTFKAPIQR